MSVASHLAGKDPKVRATYQRLITVARTLGPVLVDEALGVELAQDDPLATRVEAEEADVLVRLALRVRFLRRIDAPVPHLDEPAIQDPPVVACS
jgi:hypothetical protein